MAIKRGKSYVAVCKLGTGFDKKTLNEVTEKLSKFIISKKVPDNYILPTNVRPNFFFQPKEVWEIGFDTITVSPNYYVGQGLISSLEPNMGLSLRFPRFIRFREDKKISDANTEESLVELYKKLNNLI